MTLSEKLTMLMMALDIKNAELSRACGLDPTVVSRLKNGRRRAAPDGPQLRKIVLGISRLAEKSGRTDELLALCGEPASAPPPEALKAWLRSGMESGNVRRSDAARGRAEFGRRLTAVMELLDISSISLARKLNLDASLISRYKSGLRAPPDGGVLTEQLSRYVVSKAEASGQTQALRRMLGANAADEPEALYAAARAWLTAAADQNADRLAVTRILERIENLSAGLGAGVPGNAPAVPEAAPPDEGDFYFGKTGLREAASRFLAQAARKGGPGELLLYSDRSMEWMTDDPAFAVRWGALMRSVLSGGTRVRIIHNIGRTNAEMHAAITLWLPMYATGLVEPYYCRDELGDRFEHTLFISDTQAVTGCAVRGAGGDYYQYVKEPSVLGGLKSQYGRLLQKSAPVVRTYTPSGHGDYLNETLRFLGGTASVSAFTPSPSVLTMPGELLRGILARNRVPDREADGMLHEHAALRAGFLACLPRLSFTEITPLITGPADFPSDLSVNLGPFQTGGRLSYTRSEYAGHLSAVRDLLRAESNFHLRPLGGAPFRNLEILQKAGSATLLSKTDAPCVAFDMRPPPMTAAFKSFLDDLETTALTATRAETVALLERIIRELGGA